MPVVILSTADFHSPVWTNKQHLAAGLAQRGVTVFYIESLGLRRPTISRTDIRRILGRLLDRLISKRHNDTNPELPANIRILSPFVLPFHEYWPVRFLNQLLLKMSVTRHLPGKGRFVLWTFSPLTYNLEKQASRVVYHSVDLLHSIEGVPTSTLLAAELNILGLADEVIASSRGVATHLSSAGRDNVILWENVASSELFAANRGTRIDRAIFAGNLTPGKVDLSLLNGLIQQGIKLAVAGPLGIDGSRCDHALQQIIDHPSVEYLGNLGLHDLAKEVGKSKVGLIPYLKNDYTRGVFPMKVFEYLSAGLTVVATEIESLRGAEILGLKVIEDESFVLTVKESLDSFDESEATERTQASASKSWTNRIEEAISMVNRLSQSTK